MPRRSLQSKIDEISDYYNAALAFHETTYPETTLAKTMLNNPVRTLAAPILLAAGTYALAQGGINLVESFNLVDNLTAQDVDLIKDMQKIFWEYDRYQSMAPSSESLDFSVNLGQETLQVLTQKANNLSIVEAGDKLESLLQTIGPDVVDSTDVANSVTPFFEETNTLLDEGTLQSDAEQRGTAYSLSGIVLNAVGLACSFIGKNSIQNIYKQSREGIINPSDAKQLRAWFEGTQERNADGEKELSFEEMMKESPTRHAAADIAVHQIQQEQEYAKKYRLFGQIAQTNYNALHAHKINARFNVTEEDFNEATGKIMEYIVRIVKSSENGSNPDYMSSIISFDRHYLHYFGSDLRVRR